MIRSGLGSILTAEQIPWIPVLGAASRYRASRAVYSTDRMAPVLPAGYGVIEDAQLLNSLILKAGLYYLF